MRSVLRFLDLDDQETIESVETTPLQGVRAVGLHRLAQTIGTARRNPAAVSPFWRMAAAVTPDAAAAQRTHAFDVAARRIRRPAAARRRDDDRAAPPLAPRGRGPLRSTSAATSWRCGGTTQWTSAAARHGRPRCGPRRTLRGFTRIPASAPLCLNTARGPKRPRREPRHARSSDRRRHPHAHRTRGQGVAEIGARRRPRGDPAEGAHRAQPAARARARSWT